MGHLLPKREQLLSALAIICTTLNSCSYADGKKASPPAAEYPSDAAREDEDPVGQTGSNSLAKVPSVPVTSLFAQAMGAVGMPEVGLVPTAAYAHGDFTDWLRFTIVGSELLDQNGEKTTSILAAARIRLLFRCQSAYGELPQGRCEEVDHSCFCGTIPRSDLELRATQASDRIDVNHSKVLTERLPNLLEAADAAFAVGADSSSVTVEVRLDDILVPSISADRLAFNDLLQLSNLHLMMPYRLSDGSHHTAFFVLSLFPAAMAEGIAAKVEKAANTAVLGDDRGDLKECEHCREPDRGRTVFEPANAEWLAAEQVAGNMFQLSGSGNDCDKVKPFFEKCDLNSTNGDQNVGTDYCALGDPSQPDFDCDDFAASAQACAQKEGLGDHVRQAAYSCVRSSDWKGKGHAVNVVRWKIGQRSTWGGMQDVYRYCHVDPQDLDGTPLDCRNPTGHQAIHDCWTGDANAWSLRNGNKYAPGCASPYTKTDVYSGSTACRLHDDGSVEHVPAEAKAWFHDPKLRWFGKRQGLSDAQCSDTNYTDVCGVCPEGLAFKYVVKLKKDDPDRGILQVYRGAEGRGEMVAGGDCGSGCEEKSVSFEPRWLCREGKAVLEESFNDFESWVRCDGHSHSRWCSQLMFSYHEASGDVVKLAEIRTIPPTPTPTSSSTPTPTPTDDSSPSPGLCDRPNQSYCGTNEVGYICCDYHQVCEAEYPARCSSTPTPAPTPVPTATATPIPTAAATPQPKATSSPTWLPSSPPSTSPGTSNEPDPISESGSTWEPSPTSESTPEPSPTSESTPEPSPTSESTPEPSPTSDPTPLF